MSLPPSAEAALRHAGVDLVLDAPLARRVYWRTGGPASALSTLRDVPTLAATLAIAHAHDLPVFVLGNGSNLLVSDRGGAPVHVATDHVYDIVGHGEQVLVLGYEPTPLRVLRWADGLTMSTVAMPTEWLDHAVWVDEDTVAVSGADDAIIVVDLRSDQVVQTIGLRGRPRVLARRGQRDDRVAVGTDQGMVALVGTDHGDVMQLRGSGAPVVDLDWSPDQRHLLAVSLDGVHVHSVSGRNGSFVLRADRTFFGLVPRDDGLPLVGTPDGLLEPTGKETFALHYAGWSRGGGSCGEEVWHQVTTGLRTWPSGRTVALGPLTTVACSPDGAQIAATDTSGFSLVDTASATVVARHELGAPVVHALFGPDGTLFVSTTKHQLRLGAGEATPTEVMAIPNAQALAWWRGGLVVSTTNGTLWAEGGGAPLGYVGREPTAMAVVGDHVVVGDRDGGVHVLAEPGEPLVPLRGHEQYIHAVQGHPSGRWVATGGWDRTVWLWDLQSEPIVGRPLVGHRGAVVSLEWSADGSVLYSADQEGSVRRWTDPLATEPAALRHQVAAMAEAASRGDPMPSEAELAAMAVAPPPRQKESGEVHQSERY